MINWLLPKYFIGILMYLVNPISFKFFIIEKTICKNKLSLFISILKTFMRITKFGCVWYPIVWLISRKYLVEHSRPSMENRKLFFSFIY